MSNLNPPDQHTRPLQGERILLLGDLLSPHIEKWAAGLVRGGAEVAIFSFRDKDSCTYAPSVRQFHIKIAPSGPVALQQALEPLRRVTKNFKPTIIHSHYLTSYGLLPEMAGLPHVTSVWGKDVYRLQDRARWYRQMARQALDQAKLVCSTSHDMARVTRSLTNRHIEVVPFGVDIDFFSRHNTEIDLGRFPKANGKTRIVITKWLDNAKYGQSVLIQAVAALGRRARDVEIYLTGEAREDQALLSTMAKDLDIADQLTFTGRLSLMDIRSLYASADIAAFPSLRDDESFSVSTVEASAMTVPVIGSRIGGLRETIRHGQNGLHFEPGNHQSMAKVLDQLLSDKALCERLAQGGRALVEHEYDFEKNWRRMADLYRIFM